MKVVWTPLAIADLAAARAFIAPDSPANAMRLVERIAHAVTVLLTENPTIGRPGRQSGTRELVIPRTPYLAPYRIKGDEIQILRIYHGARRWPERL